MAIRVKPTRAEVSAAAAVMGRRGGMVKSERKAAAARKNATRPRPNRRKRTEAV